MDWPKLWTVFVSFNFKVSAAPFHFWTPDVYDGAPTVFTSFMATIVKATAIIAFVVLFHSQYKALGYSWELLLTFVLISTLLVGNITAVFQRSVKRMLAYSSIAQVGFMLFALYGPTNFANEGILLYIMAYSVASIGLFGVLIKMKDYSFEAFNGLAKKEGFVAGDLINEFKVENLDRPNKFIVYPFFFILLFIFGFLNYKKNILYCF